LVEKLDFFIPPVFDSPARGPPRNIVVQIGNEKLERRAWLPDGKKDRLNVRPFWQNTGVCQTWDGRTNGQTSCNGIVRATVCIASRS